MPPMRDWRLELAACKTLGMPTASSCVIAAVTVRMCQAPVQLSCRQAAIFAVEALLPTLQLPHAAVQ